MKPICLSIALCFVSIAACGQQTQPAASPAQATQPFLHGETVASSPQSPAHGASQPEDLHQQLGSLSTYLAGRRGLIEIPPNSPAGWWDELGNSSVRFLDDRGNTMPDKSGHITSATIDGFKGGYNNGIMLRGVETDPSPRNRYVGYMNMQFHYTAERGGNNTYNGKSGEKTDYFNILATSEMRTVGQKTGIASNLASYSDGDTMGIQSNVTQFGGYDTSGDEQTEGIRIQIQQGSSASNGTGGIFAGSVAAVHGNTLTYTPDHDASTLGEHRLIRDLSRSYSAGSIAAIVNSGGSPNTVHITGNGTHWSELGARVHTEFNELAVGGGVTQTNLAFCFDPLKSDGYDVCFPVTEIEDNNHLTVNLISTGPQQNTPWPPAWPVSGSYHLYPAVWPTSFDFAAHTLTAPDVSGVAAGDKIDQVLAYNMQIFGEWLCMGRHIGLPGKGGGINILNWGTAQSPRMGFGFGVSGNFESAIMFQPSNQKSGIPNYLASFFSDPASKILLDSTTVRAPAPPEVALWRLKDAAGQAHILLSFLRDTATACLLDASLCVSAGGAVLAKQLGQSEANDYAGTIGMGGSTSARVNFRQPFQSNPVCTLTPTSDPSAVGAYWVTATRTTVTANVRQAGNVTFNYICVGNPI